MTTSHLTYPSYEQPFHRWFAPRYECCYLLQHPFVGIAPELADRLAGYPSAEQVRSAGFKVPWSEVAALSGIGSVARLNNALLTSIGAVTPRYQDAGAARVLADWIGQQPIWCPSEGIFEELLEKDILWAFRHAGESVVHGIEEFGQSSGSRPIDEIEAAECGLHEVFDGAHGSVFPESEKFLFVVDWDSFFTLFCGPRDFVETVVAERQLEGFYCDETTSHWWSLPTAAQEP